MLEWFLMRLLILLFIMPIFSLKATPWPTPPDTISTPGVNASYPKGCIDMYGNTTMIWIENEFVVSAEKPWNGSWSGLSTLSLAGASQLEIAVDGGGNVTAFWLENGLVKTSNKLLNGNWSLSPVILSGELASNPQLAVDVTGNAVAVWEEGGYIQSSTQLLNGSWQLIPDIISDNNASNPNLSIGENGSVIVVWQTSTYSICSASKMINGNWGAFEQISALGVNSCCPHAAVDVSGNATAVWFRFNVSDDVFSDVIVQSLFLPVNGNWEKLLDVSDVNHPSVVDPNHLKLDVSSYKEGSAMAVWTSSYQGSLYNSEWSTFKYGSWYGDVFVGLNLIPGNVAVKIDSKNNAYNNWIYYDASLNEISMYGALMDLNVVQSRFSMEWLLSIGGNNNYPSLGTSPNGAITYALSSWVSHNGSNNTIQIIIASFPVVQPPASLVVTSDSVDYGVTVQNNNILNWSASPSPQASGYGIMRNGLYLTNISSTVFSYTDFNQYPTDKATYEVYAFNIYGFYSDPITFVFNN